MADEENNTEEEDEETEEEESSTAEIEQEELELLREKARKADELAAENQKLKDKDYNFRKVEKAKDEAERKADKKVSKKEKEIEDERTELQKLREDIKAENEQFKKDQLIGTHNKALDNICGDDEELRKRVEYEAKYIVGPMNNEEQIKDKYDKAYLLATGKKAEPGALYATGNISSSGWKKSKKKGFTETDRGKQAYKNWFPDSPSSGKDEGGGSLAKRHLY